MAAVTLEKLKYLQSLSHEEKIQLTIAKLYELCRFTNWKIAVSFSGGKDSSVLLDITARFWAMNADFHGNAPLTVVFANTGNEFSGMEAFVKEYCAYIEKKYGIAVDLHIVCGKETFVEVVKTEGYPIGSKLLSRQVKDIRRWIKTEDICWDDVKDRLDDRIPSANLLRSLHASNTVVLYLTGIKQDNTVSKHSKMPKRWRPLVVAPFEVSPVCCAILKKAPIKAIQRKLKLSPVIAEMADDAGTRRAAYLQTGCNLFKKDKAISKPMGFWLEQDVLRYIDVCELPYFFRYGALACNEDGTRYFTEEQRTGCKLCLFGVQIGCGAERIERLKQAEPQTVAFALKPLNENGLGYGEVIDYLNKYCKCKIKI